MDTEDYINKLLVDAGWHQGRKFDVKTKILSSFNEAYKNAVIVLSEFGGLNVGQVGSGRDLPASDISFRSDVIDFSKISLCRWHSVSSSLYAFASAHHGHMLLLVDDKNDYYIFTDPDEKLYKIGGFNELLHRVLLGVSYGAALTKA